MKKTIISLSFLLITILAFAQENEFGHVSGDTLIMNNGARFIKKQKIKLGTGSNVLRGFEYIYTSPLSVTGQGKLGGGWANYTMVIKDFRSYGSKKTGKKFFLVMGGGNISNYWCDVTPAMEHKEIIVPGINDGKEAPAVSVADELKKLKDLLDSGAITKEEYEALKKKLIN